MLLPFYTQTSLNLLPPNYSSTTYPKRSQLLHDLMKIEQGDYETKVPSPRRTEDASMRSFKIVSKPKSSTGVIY